jgi:hypothetical protein
MKLIKPGRKLWAGLSVLGVFLLVPAVISSAANLNPQAATQSKAALAAAVPDQCVLMEQKNPDEQKYRLTYNAPTTYTTTGSFFNVNCGLLTFTVPRGQDSLIDFTAAAELDCQAPQNVTSSTPTNGWCESRFLVNAVNVLPNNGGRGDTFAWDSSNGGTFDWQANTLDQVGHAFCPVSDITQAPCTYHAQLQARLDNGATSLWVDDLTIRIDVSEGRVAITNVKP